MESSQKKVTITGITGFLGAHVCLLFLKDGGFKVRGTVRDLNNQKKLAPLQKAFGEYFNKLELVQAELSDAESIDKAIEGADYVIHTASPHPLNAPKNENLIIKPAVDGTLAVMRACQKHKVKRCVITSSVVAILEGGKENRKEVYDESDWSQED